MRDKIYDKFYSELKPDDYFNWSLQKDLAYEAIDFYVVFNKLSLINIETISRPYVFTKKEIYQELFLLISHAGNVSDFEFSPDCNGGVTAVYIGGKDIIFSIDIDKNYGLKYQLIANSKLIQGSYYSENEDLENKIEWLSHLLEWID